MEDTKIYEQNDFSKDLIVQAIKQVYEILEEKGYSPVNQLVGYLISGDLGYITNYKDARNIISSFDRNDIMEVLLRSVL